MGMVTSFTRLRSEELAKLIDDPAGLDEFLWRDREEPSGYVDKAIDGIQFLLSAAGVPVYLAPLEMPGEPIENGRGDIYFGLSTAQVAEIAAHLAATPFDELAAHFDAEAMNAQQVYPMAWNADDTEYLQNNYEKLVRFFADAAARNGAVLMASG